MDSKEKEESLKEAIQLELVQKKRYGINDIKLDHLLLENIREEVKNNA